MFRTLCAVGIVAVAICASGAEHKPATKAATKAGAVPAEQKTQRLWLIGQGPDGHPYSTHEYFAGLKLLNHLLKDVPNLQISIVKGGPDWTDGADLIDSADAIVLFIAQGAHWLSQTPAQLAAFRRLAARGAGLTVLHWGMGTKEAKDIDAFVELFGACHGGPDRKYKVDKFRVELGDKSHPVLRGIAPFEIEDEFYYSLKVPPSAKMMAPLFQIAVERKTHTVAWAWERPDGGKSFGFSGLHFHRNWENEQYRRLVAQGVLWTLGRPIPKAGLRVDVTADDLKLLPQLKQAK